MLSDSLGPLLKNARKYLKLSREELATRAGVSARLVAELERSQRPNVSLESALRLLNVAGVSIVAKAPNGVAAEIRGAFASKLERAARAAHRRETWSGRRVHLHGPDDNPLPVRSKAKRLASVARVSKQAYAIAATGHGHVAVAKTKRPRR
jgi:transcriptional regulator with XRE-family HTH domain